MAVLIEGISVVIKMSSIVNQFSGGLEHFIAQVPNRTLCADTELVRIGFMTPADTQSFVERLGRNGLLYRSQGRAVDVVVVDQQSGFVIPCEWAEFGTTHWNNNSRCPIAVCRATPSNVDQVVVPEGWRFEQSLSAQHTFIQNGELPSHLRFVRRESEIDVYQDTRDGKEYFVGRTQS